MLPRRIALTLLLGQNPGPDRQGRPCRAVRPSANSYWLASRLLERRPDLREAEENLIAANANVGVAKANFFPTISLNGLFGGVSPQLSELTFAGKTWNLAGDLAGPLFTGGRLKNEYRASLAQRDQAKIAFEKSVTQAFGEVSSPSRPIKNWPRPTEENRIVDAYRESVRLSTIRYDSGLSSYLEIIDAEFQLYPAETFHDHLRFRTQVALVNLYRALGGGWNLTDTQWTDAGGTPATPQTTAP